MNILRPLFELERNSLTYYLNNRRFHSEGNTSAFNESSKEKNIKFTKPLSYRNYDLIKLFEFN
ncbi:MAG: hypothetical protein ACTS4W_00530, partial [Candidatus Hodgkinia cicadicola]